ncbi:NAD(P)-dependent oxidoreductase [Amylibacter sp.]|nr:NAD(P)-dependent oxidoreductase [Amylibacter sp.]
MRILITGATGFVGLPVVKQLSKDGHRILALTRCVNSDFGDLEAEWLASDLSKSSTYKDKIFEFKPEIVIHLAWQDIPNFSFEKSKQNLNQSLQVLKIAIEAGFCKKILTSGSCFELNKLNGECLEIDTGTPKDDFTWAKHSLRSWLEINCPKYGITLGWFRIFYVYGPGQRQASLVPMILTSLKTNTPFSLRAPNNANDFIFVDDVAKLFSSAINIDFPSGIYNLGSGKATPVIDVCRQAEDIVNGSDLLTLKLMTETESSKIDVCFWANTSRSNKYLGWKPKVDLAEGIMRTWKSLKSE